MNGKVRYVGCTDAQMKFGGCNDPRPALMVEAIYSVEKQEVHSWYTKVKLKGIRGMFNSVCFKQVK